MKLSTRAKKMFWRGLFVVISCSLCGLVVFFYWARGPRREVVIFVDPHASGPLSRQIADRFAEALAPSPLIEQRESGATTLKLYYGTNRQLDHRTAQRHVYRDQRGELTFGEAAIQFPSEHQRGRLEEPAHGESEGVSVIHSQRVTRSRWLQRLNESVALTAQKDLLLVVHGYNVRHDAALCRAAQIGLDMPFNGVVVCYTWPSTGNMSGYLQDENQARNSASAFRKFLHALVAHLTPTTKIHVLAHSIGNRVLLSGLQELAGRNQLQQRIDNVVLAAPDVGHTRFAQQIPAAQRLAKQVTLYTSVMDHALVVSGVVHGETRAGHRWSLSHLPDLDVIDVSSIDTSLLGHCYYGSSQPILNDLFTLLKTDQSFEEKDWLEPAPGPHRPYWIFVDAPPRFVRMSGNRQTR